MVKVALIISSSFRICVLFQGAVKVMAKDLIRTRHQITKFYALKSQLQGVALRIQVTLQFSVLIYLIAHKVNISNSFHL